MTAVPELPEWDDRDEEMRTLSMPFVCVESVGGPYHDGSFVAGFQLGEISEALRTRMIAATTYLILTPLQRQADLIGMKFGYTSDILIEDDEWTQIGFTRVDTDGINPGDEG